MSAWSDARSAIGVTRWCSRTAMGEAHPGDCRGCPGYTARVRPFKLKWFLGCLLALLVAYVVLFGTVAIAMLQPPARFGTFMKHMPPALVWGGLPAPRMWKWARKGHLSEGDLAPDFSLRTALDPTRRVTLASYRGQRPVVLVFGSYT